ncbi:MAG: hypothetical protein COU68_02180 [Candidatus Pacebacteria bacterium CG10_big_fil_rev_8_21_14_0_10_45_6]|nr:MAG: hypothetical protein COU68_02180 [Candidatus Pacebacteria bacterium CG10_big_fil_rev_8_21_14_0_10_45_6]
MHKPPAHGGFFFFMDTLHNFEQTITKGGWNLKKQFLDAVQAKGGWANCHAHLDKSFYITRASLAESMRDMEVKWRSADEIKATDTQEQVEARISLGLDILIEQGASKTVSFVDGFSRIGTKAIDAARNVQKKYADNILFKTISQPIAGLTNDQTNLAAYEAVTEKVDIVGGLPSIDRPNDKKHLDIIFSLAKNQNKPLHIHTDQENNPHERDTEKVIEFTKKFGYQGRVVLVHAISISAQPKEYRTHIYKELADLGIAVVVCPSAALSMRQLDQYSAPVHNSIANVREMIEAGVLVGLGVDNIADYYLPFVDGDMWVETRMLMEATRFYDFDALVDIATVNGEKIINII